MKSNMNVDELLPEESFFTDAAGAIAADANEDSNEDFASSTPQAQDVAQADFSFIPEEVGLLPESNNDEGYGKESSLLFEGEDDDDEDEENPIKTIEQLHSPKGLMSPSFDSKMTQTTQTTSDQEEAERELHDDTFSFLIYNPVKSLPFLLGVMVFIFQVFIYAVLLDNIYDPGNKKNPFGFPFNVPLPVRISEVLAIFISIITQSDIRKAICLYRDGFDDSTTRPITQVFEGATKCKWAWSIASRAIEGALGLVTTFLLIMRSDSVLDLLLNFSAIEFVTELDDLVFKLAREKFLGGRVKKQAKKVSEEKYSVNKKYANPMKAKWVSFAYFVFLCASFFGGWLDIYLKQRDGAYLCQMIFSQFGDEINPNLGTFTGLFYKHANAKFGDRSSYRGSDIDDTERGPLLAYCKNDTRWTLSLTEDGDDWKKWNPCSWTAASSESTSFDLLSTTSSPWVIKTPTNREAPLTHHFLACYECSNVKNFCGDQGKCVPARKSATKFTKYGMWLPSDQPGTAEFDRCVCNEGRYGLRCEYSQPCDTVKVNQGFPKDGGGQFASKYYRLKGADTYHRPVYTSRGENQPFTNGTDFILFTGERWIMSQKYLFPDLQNVNDEDELVQYFSKFHGYFTDYRAAYESEPIYISEVLDAKIKASPLSVRWRSRTGLQKDFVETEFLCAKCNELFPCFNDGVCQSNGTCTDCTDDYSGSRCEIPPISLSDGHCDTLHNSIKFEYDGGDCCDNKCRSTSENMCGKDGLGYIDIGYPWPPCAPIQWEISADPIIGGGQAVALSGNGKVLAVADPDLSIVRLFDKDGAEWKQRGRHIQGKSDSHFGAAISLSAESINIVGNPHTLPTVTLAVGAPKAGLVRLFTCSNDGCIQKGEDIIGGLRFGSSLSISEDGKSVAIGGATRDMVSQRTATSGKVKVFALTNDTWVERGSLNFDAPSLRKLSDSLQSSLQGYYVSLSHDYLAVGTLEGSFSPGPRFESVKLITQVFQWNKSTETWERLGDDIEKDFYDDASLGTPWPHKAVVMKRSVLAIGYKSSVDVYSWNENAWSKREIMLATGPEDFAGWSVDLSEDASILAVGTSVENPLPTDESIQMYKWNGTHYIALFNGVPAGPAASLSLSSDGRAVAVGLPFDSSNGGSTRVYNFYAESPCDDKSKVPVRISFTTDKSPQESSWELQVDSEVKLRSGSLSGHPYTTFVEEVCVPTTSCVRFLVNDTQGDGLTSPGVFALMLNGIEVLRGSDSGSYVTNCDEHVNSFPSASPIHQPPILPPSRSPTSFGPTVTKYPSASPTVPPPSLLPSRSPTSFGPTVTKNPSASRTVPPPSLLPSISPTSLGPTVTKNPSSSPTVPQPPTPLPSRSPTSLGPTVTENPSSSSTVPQPPTLLPSTSPTVTENPSSSPSKQCIDESGLKSDLIRIEITYGEEPRNSYWELKDKASDKIIVDVRYGVEKQKIERDICKPMDVCYIFKLESTKDTSALIFLNGEQFKNATTGDTVEIGNSC